MIAEDNVDMESLQAQIDMSMSFAHSLVTSWIKPTHFAQLGSSGVNATQVLEEELRRPPRLGVGASIPTAVPLAHEASKLKRRLGKSGEKIERAMELQPQDSSKSDDEEHKGRPTKQKAKVDPFEREGSKKKRKVDPGANRYPSAENLSKHPVTLLKNSTLGEPKKHDSSIGKEKLQVGPGDQRTHLTEGQQSTPRSSSSVRLLVETASLPSLTAPNVPSLSEPSQETSAPVPGGKHQKSSRIHTNSMPMPDKAKPLGIPLLNLDGPPGPTVKPGNTNGLNNSKKKRRRRKKKKSLMATGTEDKSH